jgi:D-alanyl-D-alanine carboxypeptidase/D-alanyl-D-alanine-endopeptidase (penicillin-binding protein 4)
VGPEPGGWPRPGGLFVAATPGGAVLRAGLPLSCRTGTLAGRRCGRWLTGRVRAKTGTLSRIEALAGYATTRSRCPVVFPVLMSGSRTPARAIARLDGVVAVLARGMIEAHPAGHLAREPT